MKWIYLAALICLGSPAYANFDSRVAVARGSYAQTAIVNGSSTTGTAFISGNAKRVDGVVFNNTNTTVWIGTTSTTLQIDHSNITMGFPLLSSATFKLDGMFTDALYFTCDNTVSVCSLRVLEGRTR